VLIIIRPGFQEFNMGVLLAFGSGVCSALSLLLTRFLAGSSSALATTFYNSLFGAAIASVVVIYFWKTPDQHQLMMFLLLALIGTTGNYLTVLACEYARTFWLCRNDQRGICRLVFLRRLSRPVDIRWSSNSCGVRDLYFKSRTPQKN
jgi:hypothetical protein